MIHIGIYEWSEIIIGIFLIWIGVYLLTRNPFYRLSWIVFGMIFSFGFSLVTDPILLNTPSLPSYIFWQKLTDWPYFFAPIFCYHSSLILDRKRSKAQKSTLLLGYAIAFFLTGADLRGGILLKENILRYPNYRLVDSFAPGVLMIPFVIYVALCLIFAAKHFLKNTFSGHAKYLSPALGCLALLAVDLLVGISFYTKLEPITPLATTIGVAFGNILFIYGMIRYQLFSPSEVIFGKNFLYRTAGILIILAFYISIFALSKSPLIFSTYTFLIFLGLMILISHSVYDWFITFTNDLTHNIKSGFSVVTDKEIYQALKDYNNLEHLEESSLLRLHSLASSRYHSGTNNLPVDKLRHLLKTAIEYFQPEEEDRRRTKSNLKYHLLRMIAFDEAEEGQILWELGFEDYPVKIMTRETKERKPLFQVQSPSDYSSTSRNAYLALKKEAIHDVAWRISYLEKLSKKRF